MFDLIAALTIGFIGSVHCLGMCGPLVLAYSLRMESQGSGGTAIGARPVQNGLSHHLAFHSGRLLSYGMLGASAAGLFHVAGMERTLFNFSGGIVVLGGVLMIYFGLALLKIVPLPGFLSSPGTGCGSFLGRLMNPLFRSPQLGSRIALGLAAGFLPCGLSWAMVARAAITRNMTEGFLMMVAFGLGTVPSLFLTGFSASLLSLRARFVGQRAAALSIIAMGVILVFKGARTFA